jgi:hypothetical protein
MWTNFFRAMLTLGETALATTTYMIPYCRKDSDGGKEGQKMNASLQKLVESARMIRMSEPQRAEQRISFAYGTTKIENDNITREMVVEATKVTKE